MIDERATMWITGKQAARLLGCSVAAMYVSPRVKEVVSRLRPIPGRKPAREYQLSSVLAFAERRRVLDTATAEAVNASATVRALRGRR